MPCEINLKYSTLKNKTIQFRLFEHKIDIFRWVKICTFVVLNDGNILTKINNFRIFYLA